MKLGLQDTAWEYIGAKLAQEDSIAQVKFFKAFVAEMQTWGTSYQMQMQLAYVNGELSEEEKEVLSMLGYQGE